MVKGEKEETDGDKTEQKRQRECLMQKEKTIPAGGCQQADMQIFFFSSNIQMFQRLKSQVCMSVLCLCDSRAVVTGPVTSIWPPVQHQL